MVRREDDFSYRKEEMPHAIEMVWQWRKMKRKREKKDEKQP